MKIKVCGMREADNIVQLNLLDIHYMGMIFHEPSSRHVQNNIPLCSGGIERIGVFVDKPLTYILTMSSKYSLDGAQLHGKESVELCQQVMDSGLTTIKVFSVLDQLPVAKLNEYADCCNYFLFDTKGKNPGGNGIHFSWSILDSYTEDKPFFLSGGISLEDAATIAKLKHPQLYGIDINSGFEIRPALKDINKIDEFIKTVNA